MKQRLIEELNADRSWRCSELEFYKKVPKFYTNRFFHPYLNNYYRMCIPLIYAHWEGFVVSSFRELVIYLNKQNLFYSQVQFHLRLLSNKERFGYLQGNCTKNKQKRFLREYMDEEIRGIALSPSAISAKSNLDFKQYSEILDNFEIPITKNHNKHMLLIGKLVNYRQKIAHGENSIIVYESDVNSMVACIMEMIDITICDIDTYVTNEKYLNPISLHNRKSTNT